MALTQMQVFNDFIMPATIETLAQEVEKFNAASAGTILLTTEGFTGDFLQESFYRSIHGARRRVNRYAANSTVTPTDLSQAKDIGVKVAGGFGPVLYEPSQMTWLLKPTAEGIEVASRNFAEALMQDQLNTAIAVLVAAIENNASVTVDVSATGGINYKALNTSHSKFGDRSSMIVANVMDGLTYHKLIGQNLGNAERLYTYGAVNIVDILGKVAIITDAPALSETGSPTKNKVLGLVPGAATISNSGDIISNINTTNGLERIETTLQIDYTFGVHVKGYAWDETNGGKSPTDAALATGSNWDKVVTSDKDTAGVIAVGDISLD